MRAALEKAKKKKKEEEEEEGTFPPVFIAALFTIAKTWKQPQCPSTDEWIKKMWYNGIFSTKKEGNNAICSNTNGPGDSYISKVRKRNTNTV